MFVAWSTQMPFSFLCNTPRLFLPIPENSFSIIDANRTDPLKNFWDHNLALIVASGLLGSGTSITSDTDSKRSSVAIPLAFSSSLSAANTYVELPNLGFGVVHDL